MLRREPRREQQAMAAADKEAAAARRRERPKKPRARRGPGKTRPAAAKRGPAPKRWRRAGLAAKQARRRGARRKQNKRSYRSTHLETHDAKPRRQERQDSTPHTAQDPSRGFGPERVASGLVTPRKINMEPENAPLEDDFPLQLSGFQVPELFSFPESKMCTWSGPGPGSIPWPSKSVETLPLPKVRRYHVQRRPTVGPMGHLKSRSGSARRIPSRFIFFASACPFSPHPRWWKMPSTPLRCRCARSRHWVVLFRGTCATLFYMSCEPQILDPRTPTVSAEDIPRAAKPTPTYLNHLRR